MVRESYTPRAFRGLMENPQNGREALTTVWADVGCVLKELYYSSSQSGWVMIVEGDPGTLLENQFTTWSSGALASYTAEIFHTPEDVFGHLSEQMQKQDELTTPPTAMKSTQCSSTNDHDRHLERCV